MSQSINDLITCATLQDNINQYFLLGMDPVTAKEKQGFTDLWVMSPANTNGMLQSKVSPGRGKRRAIELWYTPPILESQIGSSPAKKCTSTNEAGMLSTTYDLQPDEGSNYDEKFTLLEMANMCMDNPLWVAGRIQAMMDGIEKSIGTKNANQAALLTGAFGDGETSVVNNVKTISTRKATSGDFDLKAWAKIVFAAENAGYPGVPILFGWDEIYQYMKEAKAGCCMNEGIDIGAYTAQNDLIFIADKKIKAALGNQNFLMVAPGALQMLTWLEFEGEKGINVIDDDSYKQTVVTNPKSGIRYDFQLKNDCGDISINLKLAHKLVGLPDDLYQVGDAFQNVKWVNEFAIVNP